MKQERKVAGVVVGMMTMLMGVLVAGAPVVVAEAMVEERLAMRSGEVAEVPVALVVAENGRGRVVAENPPTTPEPKPKDEDDCVDTALFGKVCGKKEGKPIQVLLDIILKVMLYGVGALATIGFIVAGLQYALARDDPSKVVAAKQRLMNVVIGLIAYGFLFAILSWLIPGGL